MKCPHCQTENPDEANFCGKCGTKLVLICPQCGFENSPGNVFCNECGYNLSAPSETIPHEQKEPLPESQGERKYVTVLFSDLSGYTAMSERLDPEDVKEITTRIFGEAAKIIDKYAGFVEKYAGDAIMALFGVPEAHEDDPIRAIRAAREIHGMVESISPEVEERIGRPLTMHTGINTGLVVTGDVDLEKGTHGVAGDTINVAARLSSLAEADGILVGKRTFQQTEGYFQFQQVEPVIVKGRDEPVQSYRVVSLREEPVTLHHLSGLKAELIGRKAEVAELREAVNLLREGKGRIFSICGDAGTGKSRLVQEFRESLAPGQIQWLEAHAYAYTQNVPYYPLMDLFNRIFGIEEADRPERIKEKIESALQDLIGEREDLIPYVGSLYSLSYPEVEEVSPEFWKARLQEAVKDILSALALKGPTIFFLEDLHWADPSFVELLRTTLQEVRHPAVVLCVYRPSFTLFTSHQLEGLKGFYREIRLQDLSASEALDMLESLLQTDQVPSELGHFVRDKAEGNPFYLEELINSLIESDTLVKDNGTWRLTGPITESSISSSINGIITGRLDRLEREAKRVLQEASVIGRSFLYDILKRITELEGEFDQCLVGLERLDLIRTRSMQPELEYIFKHALTQEVVYNGLLKKERREIHERIGQVIESLFHDRLPEFYEALAYHYKQGESALKALDYLMKAGEKATKRYALEDAHRCYEEAYEVLGSKSGRTGEEHCLLLDLVLQWALVFYYRGDYKGLSDLLSNHRDLAESVGDRSRLGMFYSWVGTTLYYRGNHCCPVYFIMISIGYDFTCSSTCKFASKI
ncbi:MAG: AAA family ATPase [Deltaproteobacteria bacterium]|nr:AAA family ATPase [Deltaproteobacteria bacterium]